MKRLAVAMLVSAFLAGCGDAPPATTPPTIPDPSATATVVSPSPLPNPLHLPALASQLPPGDYMVVASLGSMTDPTGIPVSVLSAISIDGKNMGVLASGADVDVVASPDMTHIAYWRFTTCPHCRLSIQSLRDGSERDVPGVFTNATGHLWTPDAGKILADVDGKVELLDITSGDRRLLLDCPDVFDGGDCSVRAWSPDGKWIVFAVHTTRSGTVSPRDGLYLMDASCLADPSTCDEATRGPLLPSVDAVAWSPDSRSFAVGLRQRLVVFDIETLAQSREVPAEDVAIWHGLAWSPDGQWLAFADDGVVRLLSPATGERHLFYSGREHIDAVVFWLTISSDD